VNSFIATLGQRRERYGRITFRWILESSFVAAGDEDWQLV
jgi:hypothetical protein